MLSTMIHPAWGLGDSVIWFGRGGGRGKKSCWSCVAPRRRIDQERIDPREERKCFCWWLLKKNFHFDLRTNLPFVLVCKFLFFSSFPCFFFSSFFLWKENGVVSVEKNVSTYRKKIRYTYNSFHLSTKWIG